jgi:hypothetical protein
MAYFSPVTQVGAMQMISPENFSLLDPLVYEDSHPLAVYQFSNGAGHNFQPGKAIIGYVFLGKAGNKNAIRYFSWADQMTRRLFRTNTNPVLDMVLSLGGSAYRYRVSLLAQFYGGQHQLW